MLLVLDMHRVNESQTSSYEIGHLELTMSANSQVMLDQVLERAHMTWFKGWLFLSFYINEHNAVMFPSICLFPMHIFLTSGCFCRAGPLQACYSERVASKFVPPWITKPFILFPHQHRFVVWLSLFLGIKTRGLLLVIGRHVGRFVTCP